MSRKMQHPYRGLTGGAWLKGNLHTHTTLSDGDRTPQRSINDYAARGYDFLALTDHDLYAGSADHKKLNKKGMVLIAGNEVTARGPHIVHVGPGKFIEPAPQRQLVINGITRENGMAIIAHPNWLSAFEGSTIGQLREWVGYEGLELFNGLIGRLPGTRYCTNKWDMLLSDGRLLWGFANDDCHTNEDAEQGWNMVYSRSRSPKAILDAIRAGRFYASSGVTISKIAAKGPRIRIETEDAARIVAVTNSGVRLAQVDAAAMTVDFPDSNHSTYVRFECWGTGEAMAWTQPFWAVDDGQSTLTRV